MRKVLITGAAGMLGSKMIKCITNDSNYKVFGTGRTNIQLPGNYIQADLLNDDETEKLLQYVQPDIIIHCAANINLNDCELNADKAHKIHVNVSAKLASFKPSVCRLIYISTDSVFDGLRGNYTEEDNPQPLNIYAATKLEGEQVVLRNNPNCLIIRTNIYGFNAQKKSNSLFEWAYENLSAGNIITGFSDVLFNPLYTGQLGDVIFNSIQKNITGILNAGCAEKVSKYNFLLEIAEIFGFDKSLIKDGSSDQITTNLKRPKNTTLNIDALNKLLGKKYHLVDGINQLKKDYSNKKNAHEHIYQ